MTAPSTPAKTLDVDQLVGIDLDKALKSTMGDQVFLARVLQIFIDSQGDFESRFLAAQAGLDREASCRIVHTLKGAAANIGAESLHDAAKALEQTCKQGAEEAVVQAALALVVAELTSVLAGLVRALSHAA